jgi:tetratricopeptide (TPR) repeat protein
MRFSIQQLSCFAILLGLRGQAFARDAYGDAFAQAAAAERVGDLDTAASVLESASQVYPRDYALALRLGWVHFRLQRYTDAERWYRVASEVSNGAVDALIGLGWSLIYQQRCDRAVPILRRVIGDARARHALAGCTAEAPARGTLWLELGGALYRDDPWKDRLGSVSAGGKIMPSEALQLGIAYRFLAVAASDSRVADYAQHEGYFQLGYTRERFGVHAHGAWLSSADGGLGVSRHVGVSGRLHAMGELLCELFASSYRDAWVARIAAAWQLTSGSWTLTPGLALQRLARETLGSASLGAGFNADRWSVWIHGRYGTEYRAAYLTQFAVFNGDDRSRWAALVGLRLRVGTAGAVFMTYGFNRLKSPDGLSSDMHLLGAGTTWML